MLKKNYKVQISFTKEEILISRESVDQKEFICREYPKTDKNILRVINSLAYASFNMNSFVVK